jgi:iron complex outermembrane receptor protein
VLENSGKARIYGGELELTALLGKLQLDAGVGYANPKYTSGADVGQPIINVSKASGSVTASYRIDTRAGTLNLSSTYSYRSSAVFYALSPGLPQSVLVYNTQPGFGLLDARAAFDLARIPLTISLYAQNVTDRKYIVSADNFAPPLAFAATSPGPPRSYGATVRYTF